MSRRRKRQFRYATFAIVPALLLLAALVPAFLSATDEANALSSGEWDKVRGYIDDYISTQFQYGSEGEAGFIIPPDTLKTRIDSNSNGTYLGEGDDAANAPVLVDNLISQANVVPGTNARCLWNGGATGCFETDRVNAVKNKVDAHEAAGFSTDVIVYCLTGHTEAPTIGAFGFIAQAGGLGGSEPPNVYGLKWGRNGWNNTYGTASYTSVNPTGAATASSSYANASNAAQCNGLTPDSELVRCTARWAIYSVANGGGNVGNGQTPTGVSPLQDLSAGQIVDVRTGSPATTIADANSPTISVPLNTLFNSDLNKLNPNVTSGILFAGRTQHTGGIAAIGAKMLGYNMATNGFLHNGMPRWNNTMDEKWVSGTAYTLPAATANDVNSGIDAVAPTQSGIGHSAVTANSAVITRTASEPATMKVEYSTTPGGPYTVVNDTVLNQTSKTVNLTGLSGYTTYYYRVTSYDGLANASATSTESSFTTLDVTNPVISDILPSGEINTDSATITAYLSDTGSGIDADYTMVHLDGGAALAGCVKTTSSISCDVTGLAVGAHTIDVMARDNATPTPLTASLSGGFTVVDNAIPTVDHTGPSATVTSASTVITGTWSDPSPSSGVDESSLTVSLDGGTTTPCTIVGSDISCPVSSLTTGTYAVLMSGADLAGNPDSDTGTLDVNTDAPTIDPGSYAPAADEWTADDTPLISVDYTATGTVTAAAISVDGVDCAPVAFNDTQASCTPAEQTDGPKDVHATVNVGANQSIADWTFNVDTTAPTSGDNAPTAWQNAPLVVTLTCDDGTGVGCGASAIQYRVNFANCPDWQCELEVPQTPEGSSSWQYGATVDVNTEGVHIIDFFSTDTLGNAEDPFQTVNVGLDMSVPIISDNLPAADSFTNDSTPTISAAYSDLYSGMDLIDLEIDGAGVGTCTPTPTSLSCDAPALDDGVHTAAVIVTDHAGNGATTEWDFNVDTAGPAITNILPAGNTADTTPLIRATLADDAGVDEATVEVFLDEEVEKLAGCIVNETATSVSCQVATELPEGLHTIHVMADDVLGQTSMTEGTFTIVPEMNYYVPWYDTMYGRTWIMTSMTGGIEPNTFDFYLRNNESGQSEKLNSAALTVYADESIPSYFENEMDGPAYAQALNGPALVSERSLFGNSFEEIWAKSYEELDSHYWWPLYDNTSLGMRDWILAANPYENEENIMVRVQIHGSAINEVMELEPGESWTPLYSGIYGGPVEVTAWSASGVEGTPADERPVIASQRVLYNGAFNEMPGIGHSTELSSAYLWTWYDDASPESRDWIVMSNPSSTDPIWGLAVIGDLDDPQYVEMVQIDPLETEYVKAPGIMGGPVAVFGCADDACATASDIVASQRALWGPSFSEIAGTANVESNANWTWYDMQSAGARNWVLITNPDIAIAGLSVYAEITIHGDLVWSGTIEAMQSVAPSFPGEMNGPVTVEAWTNSGKTTEAEILASQRVLWNGYFNELVGKYQAPQ